MRTYVPKPSEIAREWYLVDAQDQTLGRFASRIAGLLMGKDKPAFAPHLDVGDFVVVVNAEKVRVTGKKLQDKLYYRHSGYPGGLRTMTLGELLKRRPARPIRLAVKGMLPKNRLGRAMLQKLKVYEGPDHPHQAQRPKPLELESSPTRRSRVESREAGAGAPSESS